MTDAEHSKLILIVENSEEDYEAVLLATIPRTARVNKKELKAPDVVYYALLLRAQLD